MLKSVFVAYDDSDSAKVALEYACLLASYVKGKVYVGHVIEAPIDPAFAAGMISGPMEDIPIMPPQAAQDWENMRQEQEEEAREILDEGNEVCQTRGVNCETRMLNGYSEEEILEQAFGVDLLALGKQDPENEEDRIAPLTEAIIRNAPQPVLVAPKIFSAPHEIMMLYDGSERALHALAIATELAYVSELPMSIITAAPTVAEAKVINDQARQYGRDHGVDAQAILVGSEESPDDELLAKLKEHAQALLVMGAFGMLRVKEWLVGSTTITVLTELDNPVILMRH